jgi:L-alanine-DL-glutamate epimerase-like enolase superfamily enzyme
MRLTIRQIETIPIRVPLPRVYRGSYYQMTHRSTIVTRIHMDEGITGEVFTGDEDHINSQIERAIQDEIAPRLIGEDAFAIERCWELARPATFNILRDRRIALVACAAVDGALWDAIGKALGQPLWRLWGGYRNTIGVIWTGGYYTADVPIEVEMAAAREAGIGG